MVLQAILTAAVVEYVVRKMQILMERERKLGELEAALSTKIGADQFGPFGEMLSKVRHDLLAAVQAPVHLSTGGSR